MRKGETGPSGEWGEHTVRTVYAGAALYLDTILRRIQAMAGALTAESTPYVMNALARAAMEAGAQLWWLLQPDTGVRRRVARFWLIRASGARYLDGTVQVIDPAAPAGTYGETPAMVRAAVNGLGLSYSERQLRNGKWSRSCEGGTLPATPPGPRHLRRRSACQPPTTSTPRRRTPSGTRSLPVPGRNPFPAFSGTVLLSRPDLVAVDGVLAAAGFAIVPADRALRLLGRTARLAEFGYHARRADDMIHRLGPPAEWSHWRR